MTGAPTICFNKWRNPSLSSVALSCPFARCSLHLTPSALGGKTEEEELQYVS